MDVHESCSVAQQATETRNASYAVMTQREAGRGHELLDNVVDTYSIRV
jgi:hypothetical protein